MKINFNFLRISRYILLISSLSLIIFSSCSHGNDSIYNTNVEDGIVKDIFTKRIVMFGENPHSHPYQYKLFLRVLDKWLTEVQNKDVKDQKLILILEADSTNGAVIDKFTINKKTDSLIDALALLDYETLEFFKDLAQFRSKIDSINKHDNQYIKFLIKGFEGESKIKSDSSFMLKSNKEMNLWYVKERDSSTSIGLIKYVKNNDDKVIMLYGGPHLANGLIKKIPDTPGLTEKEHQGYYLVYYLKKEFGEENVVTYNSMMLQQGKLNNTPFVNAMYKDFIVSGESFDNYFPSPLNKNYDFFVVQPYEYSVPHYSGYTCSRRIIDKCLTGLKDSEPFIKGEPGKRNYEDYLFDLNIICGMKFKNFSEANNYFGKIKYDGFAWINSKEYDEFIIRAVFSEDSVYSNKIKSVLGQFGISEDKLNKKDSIIWKQETWPREKEKIIYLNCMGIYWLGYQDEKIKAKEYLKEFSKEDFTAPEKYLQWYRMKYKGVEYR